MTGSRFCLQGGLLVLLACLLMLGCGGAGASKVNGENFKKIKQGMTESEVTAILGQPDTTTSENHPDMGKVTVSEWKADNFFIKLKFSREGKVFSLASGGTSRK